MRPRLYHTPEAIRRAKCAAQRRYYFNKKRKAIGLDPLKKIRSMSKQELIALFLPLVKEMVNIIVTDRRYKDTTAPSKPILSCGNMPYPLPKDNPDYNI